MTTRMYLLAMACLLGLVAFIWMVENPRPVFDFNDPLGLGGANVGLD